MNAVGSLSFPYLHCSVLRRFTSCSISQAWKHEKLVECRPWKLDELEESFMRSLALRLNNCLLGTARISARESPNAPIRQAKSLELILPS